MTPPTADDVPPRAVQPLAYATPGAGSQVVYARDGDRASVTIHRVGRRRKRAANATVEVVGELLFYVLVGAGVLVYLAPMLLVVIVPGAAAVIGIVYSLAWLRYARLDRPIVIEVTPTELVFSNLDDRARPNRLGREGLYAIRYVGHATSIFVYRRGQEMYRFGAGPEGAEGERIAAFLGGAAGLTPDTSS